MPAASIGNEPWGRVLRIERVELMGHPCYHSSMVVAAELMVSAD